MKVTLLYNALTGQNPHSLGSNYSRVPSIEVVRVGNRSQCVACNLQSQKKQHEEELILSKTIPVVARLTTSFS